MANPFVGEIKIFAGNFAPFGWAFCDGQLLPISQNTALFSLLGTQFGGNGTSNFALPNLQGSFPVGMGQGIGLTPRIIGEMGGEATVQLNASEMAGHSHIPQCSATGGTSDDPTGNLWALPHSGKAQIAAYTANTSSLVAMNAGAFTSTGGGQPHNNLPPYVVMTFIIALQGIYPARN
jgi:microcystin-dependent protein